MIVATSNRRHILKENFSDRENSVHARDTMEDVYKRQADRNFIG